MPKASIVVPAFNVAETISETLDSLKNQTLRDIEIIIIDDGSTDNTAEVVAPFLADPRIRYIKQANRGLAGARNRGIEAANSLYIGFCDADDLWLPNKMFRHVRHLERNDRLGVSYSGSALIDGNSRAMGIRQKPRLHNVQAAHILKRNPIGNGSAAVLRRSALMDIAYYPNGPDRRRAFFDETFRQSEDIECWLRIALTTDWAFAGVPGSLTQYRVVSGGLSSHTDRQLASWENVVNKLRPLHPEFFQQHEGAARAFQLRYLARRAISGGEGHMAQDYMRRAWAQSAEPLWAEPLKTLTTQGAAWFCALFKASPVKAWGRITPQPISRMERMTHEKANRSPPNG